MCYNKYVLLKKEDADDGNDETAEKAVFAPYPFS